MLCMVIDMVTHGYRWIYMVIDGYTGYSRLYMHGYTWLYTVIDEKIIGTVTV